MKSLGFPQGGIACHLGIGHEQPDDVIRQNSPHPKTRQPHSYNASKKRNSIMDLPLGSSRGSAPQSTEQPPQPPILEVKPGFYVTTAEDLLRFTSSLQEKKPTETSEPKLDYVSKERSWNSVASVPPPSCA